MATVLQHRGKVGRAFPTKKPSLHRVLGYKNPHVVERIARELKCTHKEAQELFTDTLKFLWLSGSFNRTVPSKRVDIGWHTFILFTLDYQKFCFKHFGYFLHHRPTRSTDKSDGGASIQRTLMLIKEHFGEICQISQNWQYEATAKGDCKIKYCGGCCKTGGGD